MLKFQGGPLNGKTMAEDDPAIVGRDCNGNRLHVRYAYLWLPFFGEFTSTGDYWLHDNGVCIHSDTHD